MDREQVKAARPSGTTSAVERLRELVARSASTADKLEAAFLPVMLPQEPLGPSEDQIDSSERCDLARELHGIANELETSIDQMRRMVSRADL